MRIKYLLSVMIVVVLSVSSLWSQGADSAAGWALANKEPLAAMTPESFQPLFQQGEAALQALFAGFQPEGKSDPIVITRIGAVTQYVADPKTPVAQRKLYADALLSAAEKASNKESICFFLDQLRWCGMAHQREKLLQFQSSKMPEVAELAAITLESLTTQWENCANYKAETRCAELNKSLAALSESARHAALLKAFADPEPDYAATALNWACKGATQKTTSEWVAALTTAPSLTHKIMLLDMLGERGDKSAVPTLISLTTDAEREVVAAAQRALLKLAPAEFGALMSGYLKDLADEYHYTTRNTLRFLKTSEVEEVLLKGYDSFNERGKQVALEFFRERHTQAALAIAISAAETKRDDTALLGIRVLREIAGVSEAELLFKMLSMENERRQTEARNAFAGAAQRDSGKTYLNLLLKALESSDHAVLVPYLYAAARMGGTQMLEIVSQAADSKDAALAVEAIKALGEWVDDESLPALMRYAVVAPEMRQQVLAMRSVNTRLSNPRVNKKQARQVWEPLSKLAGNEENKTAISDLLK